MPEPHAPARAGYRRLGIRAQLLALLLPGMAMLLAIDSWTDYRVSSATIADAYDQVLLEPVFALDESVTVDPRGELALQQPFAVRSMFEATQARQKHLHVGVTPVDGSGRSTGPERTLMGPGDLPRIPANASTDGGRSGPIVFYDAQYRGYAVRVATLRRVVQDGAGRRHELRIQAAESTGRREQARQALLRRELLEDGRMLFVMVLLVWIGLAWTLKPLERLRDMLRKRPAQQLAPLDPSGVPHEVAPLVEAVNQHIADHRLMLVQQAQFLADASHQLRTPLAIMMTQAGYALREHDPRKMRETLRAIIDQLSRSRRLSDQLLAMAHATRATDEEEPAPVIDLNAVAREVVLQYLSLAHEMNHDLGWVDARGEDVEESTAAGAGPPAVAVRAQAAELHEALANLLHNAIRHTPAGGRITVAVRTQQGTALAEVCDSGPGIAPDRHEAVFSRFHRGFHPAPSAAGPNAVVRGGAGLGLAIARAYARRNGGDITFSEGEPRPDGGRGLCARLQLPLAESSPAHKE